MKKLLFGLTLLLLAGGTMTVSAQNILNAEDENNLGNFYQRKISKDKEPLPYPYLRESDVIWETCIWRTVDFREKFNQFFYFPKNDHVTEDAEDAHTDLMGNGGSQGRINLARLIYKAARNGDFEVFSDDELKVPQDWELVSSKLNRFDTTQTDGEYDEDGELIAEGHDTVIVTTFNSDDYYKIKLKEYWYIDKQDTRMKVRIVSLGLIQNYCRLVAEENICSDRINFWIPMNDIRVRRVLARANAYDIYNNSKERSYDEIFISRYFDSYINRETNVYNREIHNYLTGIDAQLEAIAIEDRIFEIESDMWEY
jgi:gliding motility associated protien GldN